MAEQQTSQEVLVEDGEDAGKRIVEEAKELMDPKVDALEEEEVAKTEAPTEKNRLEGLYKFLDRFVVEIFVITLTLTTLGIHFYFFPTKK